MYAKAIFNNVADTADELEFRKGDILKVIEQDTAGFQGWWLCKLQGRQGLCPGNRLRILSTSDSGCFSSPLSSPCPSLAASATTLNSCMSPTEIFEKPSTLNWTGIGNDRNSNIISTIPSQQTPITQIQHQQGLGYRRSWHISPNKVVTPQRYGDPYVYNSTTTNKSLGAHYNHPYSQQRLVPQETFDNQNIYQNISVMSVTHSGGTEFENYDTPKAVSHLTYDCPKNVLQSQEDIAKSIKGCSSSKEEESYDIPRPLNSSLQLQNTLTPSTSNSSLLTSDCSFSSSNRSSLNNMPDYDIPRRNPLPVRAMHQAAAFSAINNHNNGQHFQTLQNVLDNCGQSKIYSLPQHNPLQENVIKELPLELSSALDTLAKLQTEATTSITRLLSYVTPNWRMRDKLEPVVMDINLSAVRLRTALHDLTEFGEGALGNAKRSEDPNLELKLKPLVKALRDADKLISESSDTLEAQGGWTLERLTRDNEKSATNPPDSLDQLIACAQTLIEDIRQSTSFIQGNASLLFKRNISHPSNINTKNINGIDLVENYDYVCFESKDAAAKTNSELRDAIPQHFQKHFDNVLKMAETTSVSASNLFPDVHETELTEKDKVLVKYYTMQITTHMGNLRQAIDSFLETVEKNQPPKYFIAYGKFVVVSAHNLVTIGDIVHRNISKNKLNQKILSCTDALSEALKTCVVKSKKAAAHFPSVTAVQEMVDAVVDISHIASDLKTAMMHAVQFTF